MCKLNEQFINFYKINYIPFINALFTAKCITNECFLSIVIIMSLFVLLSEIVLFKFKLAIVFNLQVVPLTVPRVNQVSPARAAIPVKWDTDVTKILIITINVRVSNFLLCQSIYQLLAVCHLV